MNALEIAERLGAAQVVDLGRKPVDAEDALRLASRARSEIAKEWASLPIDCGSAVLHCLTCQEADRDSTAWRVACCGMTLMLYCHTCGSGQNPAWIKEQKG